VTKPNSAPKPGMMIQSFDMLSAFLKRTSGLVVTADKLYLVENRLMPIVHREKLSCLNELVSVIEKGTKPALAKEVAQAMTVNETYFFRDKTPFDQLRDIVLPKLIGARSATKTLRIWSAACSTGQEPYSIAMLMDEFANRLSGWRIEIVGTDLSDAILTKARNGAYSQFEIQRGLSTSQLLRHFNQLGNVWQISEKLRSRVSFRALNLLDSYASLGTFDIILCRNVLIYFDVPRKADVLNRLSRALTSDGFLLLGASESVLGITDGLSAHPESRSIYVRREMPTAIRHPPAA